MALQIYRRPADVCFIADGIEYAIRNTSIPGDHEAKTLKFRLWIQSSLQDYTTKDIEILSVVSIGEEQGEDNYIVDLTDIIMSYATALTAYIDNHQVVRDGTLMGYAKVQLLSIGDTAMTDTAHVCLPGSSGGLKLTGVMSANTHPFLLARGNEDGALHFYRSELEAMEDIYCYITNFYGEYHIETDNAVEGDQDLDGKYIFIDGVHNIFGIWLIDDVYSQYGIYRDANALFVHYHYYDEHENEKAIIHAIAIMDDPDTDDCCMLKWTNSMGAPEALLLTGEMRDISEIDNPDLYITQQTPKETRRSFLRRSVTTKYSLQTGYLTPARVRAMKDMLTSDSVYMKMDGEWIQVLVTADTAHAVHQREPENFELTIEVLTQTRYHKPNRTVRPLPATRAGLLQDNSGNIILDNNSNTIQENG